MADYSTILAAIDEAIKQWAGKPIMITSESGRSVKYRSLKELTDARKNYAILAAQSANKEPLKSKEQPFQAQNAVLLICNALM